MTLIRRGAAKKKHEARVAWITQDINLYRDVPGIHDDVTPTGRVALERLCGLMNAMGLFGSSGKDAQRETVRRLVSELRGEHVGVSW